MSHKNPYRDLIKILEDLTLFWLLKGPNVTQSPKKVYYLPNRIC